MQEVKFNYQNITAVVEKDKVRVVNKNLFVNTDSFDCVVLLEKDGRLLKKSAWRHIQRLLQRMYTSCRWMSRHCRENMQSLSLSV